MTLSPKSVSLLRDFLDVSPEEAAELRIVLPLPLFYMRRRFNGKEGKVYGERYREYRQ